MQASVLRLRAYAMLRAAPTAESQLPAATGWRESPLAPLRLGLCCQFAEAPIKFRTTTATACQRITPAARAEKLATLCRHNAAALLESLEYCTAHGIGCFRVNSQILPVVTHPQVGYRVEDLPGGWDIVAAFRACGAFAAANQLRLSFHPDQFVVLNSPRADVVERSLADIENQAEVAEWVGADVVNIHAGGAYGDKTAALERFARGLERLAPRARARLTLENDDVTYTVVDLLPLCTREGVPLVYDVHHHRCLGDGFSVEEATAAAAATWNREPMVHLSSPKAGWHGPAPERHHDDIDVADFPACWWGRAMTVEVEAKAKERAIAKLQRELAARFAPAQCEGT
jgi:UV DNA damage endonuclease